MSEAIENTSIGRSHGRLTGPIFLRAVDQLHLLEFRSARSKDWPVNQREDVEEFLTRQAQRRTHFYYTPDLPLATAVKR